MLQFQGKEGFEVLKNKELLLLPEFGGQILRVPSHAKYPLEDFEVKRSNYLTWKHSPPAKYHYIVVPHPFKHVKKGKKSKHGDMVSQDLPIPSQGGNEGERFNQE